VEQDPHQRTTEQTSPHPKQTKINSAQFLGGPSRPPETLPIETLIVVVKFKGLPTVAIDFFEERFQGEVEDMVENLPVVLEQTYVALTGPK